MIFRKGILNDFENMKKNAIAKKIQNAIMVLMKNISGRIYYEKENVDLNRINFDYAIELHITIICGKCSTGRRDSG